MLRLLSIEFHKLKYNRASKTLSIIYFGLLLSIALVTTIKFEFGDFKLHLADQGIFNFPYIWHFNTYMAAILKFFLLLVIVSMVSDEYSYKTLKQNLIDGLSKKEFILSKFYTIVFFSFLATLLLALISLFIGLYYSSYDEFNIIIKETDYLLAYFFKLVGFFSFCLFLAMLVKRSAFALAFLFIDFILEWILLGIIAWKSDLAFASKIQNFFPLKSMYNLIEQPFQRIAMTKFPNKEDLSYDFVLHWYELLIVIIWTILFIIFSYRLLKRRDL